MFAFGKFIQRDWFRRAWTYQEFIIPQSISLLCGNTFLSGKAFEETTLKCQLASSARIHDRVHQRRLFQRNHFLPFVRALITLSTLRTTDSRDNVYAALGVARNASVLVPCPDYTAPISQVYSTVISGLVNLYGRLDLLCLNHWKKTKRGLLSWIPDLHTLPHLQVPTMMTDNLWLISMLSTPIYRITDSKFPASERSHWDEHGQKFPNLLSSAVNVNGSLLRHCRIDNGYRADGGSAANVSISSDYKFLTVHGIWIPWVAGLGGHLLYEPQEGDFQDHLADPTVPEVRLPMEQPFNIANPFTSNHAFRDAFVRTFRLCPCTSESCREIGRPCQTDRAKHQPCDAMEIEVFAYVCELVLAQDGKGLKECLGCWAPWFEEWWQRIEHFGLEIRLWGTCSPSDLQ
jgi:hypothetical protein